MVVGLVCATLIIAFWQHDSYRDSQLDEWESVRSHFERLREQVAGEERAMVDYREQTIPYREFYEIWSTTSHEMEVGHLFLALDELAFDYNLATSKKATSRRQEWGRRDQGSQVTVLSLTVTGNYRQVLLFMNEIPFRFPLLKTDMLNIRPVGVHSVETAFQFSIPQL